MYGLSYQCIHKPKLFPYAPFRFYNRRKIIFRQLNGFNRLTLECLTDDYVNNNHDVRVARHQYQCESPLLNYLTYPVYQKPGMSQENVTQTDVSGS